MNETQKSHRKGQSEVKMAPVEYCSGNPLAYEDSRLPGDPSGGQVPPGHCPCRHELPESRCKPGPGKISSRSEKSDQDTSPHDDDLSPSAAPI